MSDMVTNEHASNISSLGTKNSGLAAIITTSFLYVEDHNGYLHRPYVLLENHNYLKIFASKTLSIRK